MPWEPVNDDEELEEGDKVQTFHCVSVPDWPGQDWIAQLTVSLSNLQSQTNSELPDCMTVEVLDQELRDGGGEVVAGEECDYMYVTTFEVVDLEADCPPQTAVALGQVLIVALAAILVLGAISLTFYQARKFTQSPGGEETAKNVSTALLFVAGGWAFTQFAGDGEGGLLGEPEDPEESDEKESADT